MRVSVESIFAEPGKLRDAGVKQNPSAIPLADTAMAIDPRDKWTDRRQLDVVVGMDVRLVGQAEGVVAMRTAAQRGLDDLIRLLDQRAGHPGATAAGRLRRAIRQVRLVPLRGRQTGVVRCLRRRRQPGFQFDDPRRQHTDLLSLRRNLRLLRQDEGDQLVAGEGG